MRCLGQIANRKETERFIAYLLTEGITTQIEPVEESDDLWEIWVRDEDRLKQAAELLAEFRSNPQDAKYQSAVQQASQVLADRAKQQRMAQQNLRRPKYQSGLAANRKIPPLTLTLLILSCIVSILNGFGDPSASNEIGQSISRQMMFVNPLDYQASQNDPAVNLKKGQLWRIFTPIFIHLSPLHLLLNVVMLAMLGRFAERWLGTPIFFLFVLLAAALPNLLQALAPEALRGNPLFGGISGVVYAMFGLVWIRSVLNPMLGIQIPFIYVLLMIMPIVIGFLGLVPGWIHADLCHLGGLLIGIATAHWLEHRR